MKVQLWDDPAFQGRLEVAAKRKGLTVAKALVLAGASRHYFSKEVDGRSTNTILNLERVLDCRPGELFGIESPELEIPLVTRMLKETAANGDPGRHQRVTTVAQTIVAQLATLVYVACSKSDTDPAGLMQFVMREISREQQPADEMADPSIRPGKSRGPRRG